LFHSCEAVPPLTWARLIELTGSASLEIHNSAALLAAIQK